MTIWCLKESASAYKSTMILCSCGFLQINSCRLNLLFVRSLLAKLIVVKRVMQGRSKVTRVRVEPISCYQDCRKNDTFTLSATLQVIMLPYSAENQGWRAVDNIVFYLIEVRFEFWPCIPETSALPLLTGQSNNVEWDVLLICNNNFRASARAIIFQ